MQKVFEKIIERLEEKIEVWRKDVTSGVKQDDGYLSLDTAKKSGRIKGLLDAQEIVNQVASDYEKEVCEWKKDKIMSGMYMTSSGYVTYLKDFKYCPYCGKKIKIIEPYKAESEE